MRKIAIILARSGSKGLKDKNMLFLYNKPLCFYTIDAAIESNEFDEIVFSSDSEKYINDVKIIYADKLTYHKRTEQEASDKTSSYDSLKLILENYNGGDTFCLLQPTSPLRNAEHIKEAFNLFNGNNMVVSFCKASKPTSLYMNLDTNYYLTSDTKLSSYGRQTFEQQYTPNGAIYIANIKKYLELKTFFLKGNTQAYLMDKISSIDIDDIEDFNIALSIIRDKSNQSKLFNSLQTKFNSFVHNKHLKNVVLGDSLVEYWPLPKNISNWGIATIRSEQYVKLINSANLNIDIDNLYILIGSNDLASSNNVNEILKNISLIISTLKPKQIKVLSVPYTIYRNDRGKEFISKVRILNDELKLIYKDDFIDINKYICDQNNLLLQYSLDGLHLNDSAYELLNKKVF